MTASSKVLRGREADVHGGRRLVEGGLARHAPGACWQTRLGRPESRTGKDSVRRLAPTHVDAHRQRIVDTDEIRCRLWVGLQAGGPDAGRQTPDIDGAHHDTNVQMANFSTTNIGISRFATQGKRERGRMGKEARARRRPAWAVPTKHGHRDFAGHQPASWMRC